MNWNKFGKYEQLCDFFFPKMFVKMMAYVHSEKNCVTNTCFDSAVLVYIFDLLTTVSKCWNYGDFLLQVSYLYLILLFW